jgi:hypothetical protein
LNERCHEHSLEEHLGLATASFCHWPSHERFTCFSRGHWNIANDYQEECTLSSVAECAFSRTPKRILHPFSHERILLFCLERPERKQ